MTRQARTRTPSPVSLIDQLDAEFIARGVKFVIQTGDLTDQGTTPR